LRVHDRYKSRLIHGCGEKVIDLLLCRVPSKCSQNHARLVGRKLAIAIAVKKVERLVLVKDRLGRFFFLFSLFTRTCVVAWETSARAQSTENRCQKGKTKGGLNKVGRTKKRATREGEGNDK
jgi:hypothetical protein